MAAADSYRLTNEKQAAGKLQDHSKDVGDEDGYACSQTDVPGDAVPFALDLEKLATGRSSAYGDESEGERDYGEEQDHKAR
jgi:hypothetical protein